MNTKDSKIAQEGKVIKQRIVNAASSNLNFSFVRSAAPLKDQETCIGNQNVKSIVEKVHFHVDSVTSLGVITPDSGQLGNY